MFGNNINNPFMTSNMYGPSMMNNYMMQGSPIIGNSMLRSTPITGGTARGSGLLSSLFGGRGTLSQGLKSFNFSSLLNNTSKALGVIKEAIPIVKEVGPMVGNMKQMLKIASIFKDETDINTKSNNLEKSILNTENETNKIIKPKENDTNIISTTTNQNNNEPNFFL